MRREGHLHNARREQFDIADAGSLPEDDLLSAEVGHDDREGESGHNVVDTIGNGDTMRRAQARGAEHLAQAPHMVRTQTTKAADGGSRVFHV